MSELAYRVATRVLRLLPVHGLVLAAGMIVAMGALSLLKGL